MEKDITPNTSSRGALLGILVPIAVALLIGMIFLVFTPDNDGVIVNVLSSLFTEIAFVLIAFYLSKQNGTNFWVMTKANIKPKSKHIYLAIGLSIACIFLFLPIISLWENLLSTIGYKIQDGLVYDLTNPMWIIYSIFAVALLPAICEETLFRGVVLNGTRSLGIKFCVLYSALCFSLMHLNIQQLPYTFILGIICGLFCYHTHSLWPSVIFHFINNSFVLLLMCVPALQNALFGWWSALPIWAAILIALVLVVVAYFVIRFVFTHINNAPPTDQQETKSTSPKDKKLYIPLIVGAVLVIILSISRFGAL